MKKVKDVLYNIYAKITGLALIICFMGLAISGAIWAVKLLLSLIGVI